MNLKSTAQVADKPKVNGPPSETQLQPSVSKFSRSQIVKRQAVTATVILKISMQTAMSKIEP